MPHVIVEWTDNLADEIDIRALLELIAGGLRDSGGIFPFGGIRVRAVKLTDYVIADGLGDDAFVNITVKIGTGRPADFKQQFFAGLFDRVRTFFASVHASRYLALSLYVEEFNEAGGFRENNLHARFQLST